MQTAKIFINGRSQAVRLPKEFRFSGDDVFIKKFGTMVILFPKDDPWAPLVNSLDQFTDDFMENRNHARHKYMHIHHQTKTSGGHRTLQATPDFTSLCLVDNPE